MTKIKREYLKKAKYILTNKDIHKDYHKQYFEKYKYGEYTPINNDKLSFLPNGIVILSEEVYHALLAVYELTNAERKEVPFLLYGKEIDNNQILFDEFFSQSSKRFNYEVSYQSMEDDLISKVKNNTINNFVICKGHSHPSIGSYCENFSLGDLASDIQFNEDNPIFKEKKIELVSCVVTPSKDINFLYYDDNSRNFYRFGKVLVKNKNNMYSRINCYGDSHQNTQERHR